MAKYPRIFVTKEQYAQLLMDPNFVPLIDLEYVLECAYCRVENVSIFIENTCFRCGAPLTEASELLGMLLGREEVWIRPPRDGVENLQI